MNARKNIKKRKKNNENRIQKFILKNKENMVGFFSRQYVQIKKWFSLQFSFCYYGYVQYKKTQECKTFLKSIFKTSSGTDTHIQKHVNNMVKETLCFNQTLNVSSAQIKLCKQNTYCKQKIILAVIFALIKQYVCKFMIANLKKKKSNCSCSNKGEFIQFGWQSNQSNSECQTAGKNNSGGTQVLS